MKKTFFIGTNDLAIKAQNSEDNSLVIAGYANTSDRDRMGDIVKPEAWAKGIDNFRLNPILLLQHDHDKPIGKVTSVVVDKKGLFVEAVLSSAAESNYGVNTLIRDGVLKSFSVGFMVKDASYDKQEDILFIEDVELLEISVVSVPANQYSLFSVKKSFDNDEEYNTFRKSFAKEEEVDTSITEEVKVEEPVEEVIEEKQVFAEEGKIPLTVDEGVSTTTKPDVKIPFYNMLNLDTSKILEKSFVRIKDARYIVSEIATDETKTFTFDKCDILGKSLNETIKVPATDIIVVNNWDLGSEFDIHLVVDDSESLSENEKTEISKLYKSLSTKTELDLCNLKSSSDVINTKTLQRILNDTINLASLNVSDWKDSHYKLANKHCNVIKSLINIPENSNREVMLSVYGFGIQHDTLKEKVNMTTEVVGGDPLVIRTKSASEEKSSAGAATVSEPRVAELIAKTGEAMLAAEKATYVAEETKKSVDPSVLEELAELRGQMKAYKEQISAYTQSKMAYHESTRSVEQFTDAEKSNAVILAAALNKSVFDTGLGARMKAVVTDSHLKEAYSINTFNEMQQELVVAPMFQRMGINVKDFRIPVADEDISDYVAQFPSGSFAAGVDDTTTVSTMRQAQIASITLSPKKFMVSTFIAKDEDEDTLLAIVDMLRTSSVRRLARGIDKAILRGDGTLSAFSASNALTSGGTYPSVIKGLVELAAGVGGLVNTTATTSTFATPAQIAAARLALGRYGLVLGSNLAYITSVEGYNKLVTFSDFQTVDKFGSQATYLTGAVGAIYGIPIYVSEFMDVAGVANANLGVLVYKPGFIIGERRAMEIESEYLPRQQVTAMYMSTRFDFKALTTVANADLSTRYSYASLVTTAAA